MTVHLPVFPYNDSFVKKRSDLRQLFLQTAVPYSVFGPDAGRYILKATLVLLFTCIVYCCADCGKNLFDTTILLFNVFVYVYDKFVQPSAQTIKINLSNQPGLGCSSGKSFQQH